MKNNVTRILLLIIAAAGPFTACKKDKKSEGPCDRMELAEKASVNYKQPVAIAISKSGITAVVEYNGFNAYGTNGITTIWNSYNDFVEKKAPLQTFQSVGAEAVVFDGSENLYIAETEATAGIKTYRKVLQDGVVKYQYNSVIQGNGLAGGFVNPRGIAFDDKGRLYIANDGVGNIIKVIDPMGAATKQIIAGSFGNIKGLAISGSTLYVTMYNDDRIAKCTLKLNGDFDQITGVYLVSKPVDIAIKDGILAISSPESGLITLVEADKLPGGNAEYTGCKKEINVGNRLFGLAFNPLDNGLFAAHLGQNRVLYYKP
jgi:DNA-binding beta-propeller fold protein YncE